jgi:RimJ/RimL family protein N-acetyltransferase
VAVVPIATQRLRLRSLADDDLAQAFEILGDETTTARVSWRQPDVESCRTWLNRRIEQQAEFGFSFWGVERLHVQGLIGFCGYFPHGETEIELGYVMRADHWGHGYATEAARAALVASQALGRSVYATIRSTNTSSLAVARKIGLILQPEELEDERGTLLVFRWPPVGEESGAS